MYRLLSIYIEESTEKYNSKESNVKDKSKHNSFVKEIIHIQIETLYKTMQFRTMKKYER